MFCFLSPVYMKKCYFLACLRNKGLDNCAHTCSNLSWDPWTSTWRIKIIATLWGTGNNVNRISCHAFYYPVIFSLLWYKFISPLCFYAHGWMNILDFSAFVSTVHLQKLGNIWKGILNTLRMYVTLPLFRYLTWLLLLLCCCLTSTINS